MPLHQLLTRLGDPDGDAALLAQVGQASPRAKTEVLVDVGLTPTAFMSRFGGHSREAMRGMLLAAYRRQPGSASATVRGYLGLLLLTLVLVEEAEAARFGTARQRRRPEELRLCQELVADPSVRDWIAAVYRPPRPPPRGRATEHERVAWAKWSRIDFTTLAFHRQGTTSFIVRCRTRPSPDRDETPEDLALKLVLYPYTRLPQIAAATREYAALYRLADDEPALHIPRVWASTDKWVIMDFVPGRTLGEEIEEGAAGRATGDPVALDLGQLARLAPPLFEALAWLADRRRPLRHLDLAPSNVIVRRSGTAGEHVVMVLVDLGPNYLYTRTVSALDGPEAVYVPPEVRDVESTVDRSRSDLYSLGHILMALTGADGGQPGIVPDRFYEDAPLLARFIEDLVDHDPRRRLRLFGSPGRSPDYRDLHRHFVNELQATNSAKRARLRPSDRHWVAGLRALWPPSSKVPRRQLELWFERACQQDPGLRRRTRLPAPLAALRLLLRPPRRGAGGPGGGQAGDQARASRWLLLWSVVCSTSWWVAASVTVIWTLRDLNLDPAGILLELIRQAGGVEQQHYPLVDSLARPGYEISTSVADNVRSNLPARVVALSFALIGTKFYQSLFGNLTARFSNAPFAGVAELFIRLHSFLWLILILIGTWYEPRWWPALSAVGLAGTVAANYFCARFAQAAIARARSSASRLSTVPGAATPIAGLEEFSGWWIGMLLYVVVFVPCAWAIQAGVLHDVWVYAIFVATVNVGVFYVIKLSRRGASVRGALTRAFFAAERLGAVRQGTDRGDGRPPATAPLVASEPDRIDGPRADRQTTHQR